MTYEVQNVFQVLPTGEGAYLTTDMSRLPDLKFEMQILSSGQSLALDLLGMLKNQKPLFLAAYSKISDSTYSFMGESKTREETLQYWFFIMCKRGSYNKRSYNRNMCDMSACRYSIVQCSYCPSL